MRSQNATSVLPCCSSLVSFFWSVRGLRVREDFNSRQPLVLDAAGQHLDAAVLLRVLLHHPDPSLLDLRAKDLFLRPAGAQNLDELRKDEGGLLPSHHRLRLDAVQLEGLER